MAQVNANAETIREFKTRLNGIISEIQGAGAKVRAVGSGGWDDSQGQHFHATMQKIAQLIESPIETLKSQQPKLEKLAQSLDGYNSVKFN
jgi:uncharacterized protein YukE